MEGLSRVGIELHGEGREGIGERNGLAALGNGARHSWYKG